ncbi:MAG: hypothetical protein PHU85_10710, partial [Phycisphaerae bacterium]|nr:hypothetical protein [Phycisphaerae bacterium]
MKRLVALTVLAAVGGLLVAPIARAQDNPKPPPRQGDAPRGERPREGGPKNGDRPKDGPPRFEGEGP